MLTKKIAAPQHAPFPMYQPLLPWPVGNGLFNATNHMLLQVDELWAVTFRRARSFAGSADARSVRVARCWLSSNCQRSKLILELGQRTATTTAFTPGSNEDAFPRDLKRLHIAYLFITFVCVGTHSIPACVRARAFRYVAEDLPHPASQGQVDRTLHFLCVQLVLVRTHRARSTGSGCSRCHGLTVPRQMSVW
jgi:hypothetical protein